MLIITFQSMLVLWRLRKPAMSKRQGVVCEMLTIHEDGLEMLYFVIFDVKYNFILGLTDDKNMFVSTKDWVEYWVYEERTQPSYRYTAKEVREVEDEDLTSQNPATNAFRGGLNMNEKIQLSEFSCPKVEHCLKFKCPVSYKTVNGQEGFYNEYYGRVSIERDALRQLLHFNIRELYVIMRLVKASEFMAGRCPWTIEQFVHLGKAYSLSGFLSILGKVLRGPGGHIRPRHEVYIPPDSLRPLNTVRKDTERMEASGNATKPNAPSDFNGNLNPSSSSGGGLSRFSQGKF